ncbi:hypothetical protein [Pseudomonas sp. NPDC096925]|uniref:hypothetical protein n=1 Tax=Pseudomonas sp. NPDC096925 TaxID=3364484 RepID=UPI00383B4CF8
MPETLRPQCLNKEPGPWFWHGGAGIATCWYGAAEALADIWRACAPCGSGFTRETSSAVHGTGFAGVRG